MCLLQQIFNKVEEVINIEFALVSIYPFSKNQNALLAFYPLDNVDRYELNELFYGEKMFSKIVVKKCPIKPEDIKETVIALN
jgi:hypothetical protein